MSNQASEDELTYGVDLGIPGGDYTALSIKKGSTLYTFVGDEAVAIIDLIRTEKLKLLAEVRERVVGEDELYATDEAGWGVFASNREKMHANKVKSEQRTALTKLEAEL